LDVKEDESDKAAGIGMGIVMLVYLLWAFHRMFG
jgi:hypothetical protein